MPPTAPIFAIGEDDEFARGKGRLFRFLQQAMQYVQHRCTTPHTAPQIPQRRHDRRAGRLQAAELLARKGHDRAMKKPEADVGIRAIRVAACHIPEYVQHLSKVLFGGSGHIQRGEQLFRGHTIAKLKHSLAVRTQKSEFRIAPRQS